MIVINYLKIFQVIVYGLLPLAFFSTLLSSSMRRKRQARTDQNDEGSKIKEVKAWVGRLNKTKIILTVFSGSLVYYAANILSVYHQKGQFFSCNLTTIVPRNGPWEKLNQLSSIDTTAPKELFSREYLFDENLWMTLGKIFKLLDLKCSCVYIMYKLMVLL